MVPTNDISVFLEKNDLEFRNLVKRQCEFLNYPGESDDIAQELYVQFLTTKKIIEFYDESLGYQMSTYLFKIIRNFIIIQDKSHDGHFNRCRVLTPISIDDTNEFDIINYYYEVSEDYKNNQYYNNTCNNENKLLDDLNDFERQFTNSSQNVTYTLRKKRHKKKTLNYLKTLDRLRKRKRIGYEFDEIRNMINSIEKHGCTLLDLFQLLYKGYTNTQISVIYGVSTTTISAMKNKLSKAMIRYGFFSKDKS